jgi:hypothetical protein
MNERYDVYFAGQILDGYDSDSVRNKLAKLFNADQATLDLLFSGKTQVIKRNCDHATALQYKSAIEQAGARPILKVIEAEAGTENGADPKMSAAQKIAALAAAPDEGRYEQSGGDAPPHEEPREPTGEPESIDLAPPGTEVLREEERAESVSIEIDTSGLQVDMAADRLPEDATPPPATVDTGHLSLADAGETIPNLPTTETPVSPSLDGLALSDAGTDFSDCASPATQAPTLDLSALTLESPGSDMLEEKYRKTEPGTGPSTDHLSLED